MTVTAEQIAEWKEVNKKVFKVTLDTTDYYYTTLKRDVYVDLLTKQQLDPEFDYEFETMKACLLSPEVTDAFKQEMQDKSGLSVMLLEQIMMRSGWQQVESEEL